MKFTVQMKDPDTLDDSIKRAVNDSLKSMAPLEGEEVDALAEVRETKARKACLKWFRYGEYLAVEIDTEAGTCTVLEAT
jgi:hypothetical protein